MSVINTMLNEIEQREQSQQAKSAKKLDYLEVNEPRYSSKWLLVLLAVCILGVVLWLSRGFLISEPEVVLQQPIVEEEVLANEPQANEVSPATDIVVKNDAQEPKVNEQTSLPVINARKRQPVIAEQKDIVVEDDTPQQKQIQEQVVKPLPAKQNTHLSIKPVKLSASELAALKYNQGLKQQQQGELVEAQQSWRQALAAQQSLHDARESLAASFYGANRVDSALGVLERGKQLYPDHEGYRIMMAQILFKQQRAKLALATLEQPFNNENSSNEALVLAGSIAQNLTLWHQAEQNYQVLNLRQPKQSKWLIGLATSLDGQGKLESAKYYYQQFLSITGIEGALSQYATERLNQIEQQIQTREDNG